MSHITISEAAKILGKTKRTLIRWDKDGRFPAKREEVSRIRLYDKDLTEKTSRWFDLRRREKEHLRKLPAINQKRDKFIPIVPLSPLTNPKGYNYEEMKQAYKEHDEWDKKYNELQEEYAEFTEGFYGRLEK